MVIKGPYVHGMYVCTPQAAPVVVVNPNTGTEFPGFGPGLEYPKACPDGVKKDGHFCSKSLAPPGGKFKPSNLRFEVWPLTEMSIGSKCAEFYFLSSANTNILIWCLQRLQKDKIS